MTTAAGFHCQSFNYSNVVGPPQSETNFLSILKLPLYQKCYSLTAIIQEAIMNNAKEIHSYFPVIVENIFSFGSQSNGSDWSLKTLSRFSDSSSFDAVFTFLSPDGVLFSLIKHLMYDPGFKCYFPITYLPASTKAVIEKGIIPEFYLNRISGDINASKYSQIALNAVEFYLFHFFHFLCNEEFKLQSLVEKFHGNNSSSAVHITLLETYLNYFLPLTIDSTINVTTTNTNTNLNQSIWKSLSSTTSNLLHLGSGVEENIISNSYQKSKLLNLTPLLNITSRIDSPATSSENRIMNNLGSATWKADTFLHIFTELILTVNSTLPTNPQIDSVLSPMYVSNSEQMRCIRIFVKHMHYFANSVSNQNSSFCGALDTNELDVVKRSVWTNRYRVQRRLYSFLRASFEHWPLDASFRLPLETWLSYIQPWRYIGMNETKRSLTDMDDSWSVNCDDCASKWKQFICDNLLFYTVLFENVIPRFTRLDLTSSKNSLMLFRVVKVFCQQNLIEVLIEVEQNMETLCTSHIWSPPRALLLSPSLRNSSPSSQNSYRHNLAVDCEQPDFVYSPLTSNKTKVILQKLLIEVVKAKEDINESIKFYLQKGKDSNSTGFLNFFKSLFSDDEDATEERRILSDLQKTESHLSMVKSKLYETFELNLTELELSTISKKSSETTFQKLRSPEKSRKADIIHDSFGTPKLSESGRYQVLNKIREPAVGYLGNPDTQPVRSFEVAFLVSLFTFISGAINHKYTDKFVSLYNRQDIIGYIVRSLLTPPTTFVKLEKRGVLVPPSRIVETLPPRVNLRFLANKKILVYILLLPIFNYIFGFGAFTFSSLAVYTVFCCAVILSVKDKL